LQCGIRSKLLEGSYQPQAVRQVAIPKPDGGERILGIPTVLDRLIQQAIAQVLTPIFDPNFSEESYGFRPCRDARQAVRKAQGYQHEGKRWVVDLDLEKFFDVVNHDILMQCLRGRVSDPVLLKLIGRYLRSGIMEEGIVSQRQQGTPQGGPLSPLLSNILLDRFDKELSKRGHSFVRYADDCNIYVSSKRAAQRVLKSVTEWLRKKLKLKVNATKSAVDRPWKRKFLGYSVTNHKKAKLRIAPQSVKRFKVKVKMLMRKGKGKGAKPWSLHKRGSKPTIAGMDPLLWSGRDQRHPG
jgi:RNA-directed DNA polymerase